MTDPIYMLFLVCADLDLHAVSIRSIDFTKCNGSKKFQPDPLPNKIKDPDEMGF